MFLLSFFKDKCQTKLVTNLGRRKDFVRNLVNLQTNGWFFFSSPSYSRGQFFLISLLCLPPSKFKAIPSSPFLEVFLFFLCSKFQCQINFAINCLFETSNCVCIQHCMLSPLLLHARPTTHSKLPSFTILRELYFTCKFLISRPTNRGLFTVVHICQLLLHNTTYEFDSLGLVACHAASSSVYLLTFRGFNLAMKTPSNHTPPRDGINYILTSLGFVHVVRFVSVRPSRRRIQSATQPAANSSLIRRFKFGS